MATPSWIQYTEIVVGENHPTLADVANRPTKTINANFLVGHSQDGEHGLLQVTGLGLGVAGVANQIIGVGAIEIKAGGTSKNITLTPSGTEGAIILNGYAKNTAGGFVLYKDATIGGGMYTHKVITGSGTDLSPVLFAESATGCLYFYTGGSTTSWKAKILADGKVGVGGITPNYQFEISTDSAGKPSTNTWTIVSDERLKENIQLANLDRCYEIVKLLPLKRFSWKDEVYTVKQARDRSKLGWVSQDVKALFPKSTDIHKFEGVPVEDGIEEYEEEGVIKTRPKYKPSVIIEDCLDLNADQIYAAMFGAIQKLIEKVEALEVESMLKI